VWAWELLAPSPVELSGQWLLPVVVEAEVAPER
jgi:hypothetical protein